MADFDIPTEALEAAARALADSHDPPWVDSAWDNPPVPASVVESWRNGFRNLARDALAAAAPHLIAEGRRQAAEAIRAAAEGSPLVVMRGGDVGFGAAQAYDSAARIAEARAEVRTRRSNVLGAEWAAQIEAAEGVDHG